MSDTTKKAIALAALAENFGGTLSEQLSESWLRLLAGYTPEQVDRAVQKVIETHVYRGLPPFAVLKKALDELAGTGEKALELQAIAEWGELCKAVEEMGSYATSKFHPTTEHVVHLMGGWGAVCDWRTKDLDFKRKDFISLWINSHGRVEAMQLGAAGVQAAIAGKEEVRRVGDILPGVIKGLAENLGMKQ